jgi:hypothetical protein
MHVIDLGGDIRSWRLSRARPARLLLVNLTEQDAPEPWAESTVADACDLPRSITSQGFDLVYSNSVLEHVGGHYRRQQFAEAARALASHMWIQTPYRYFPIEPHWLFPGFQWLPVAARTRVMRHWPLGNYTGTFSSADAVKHVLNVELISQAELTSYFPDAEIWRETFFGLTKSLVATK